MKTKRVLFDSGMVLMSPKSGNWTYPKGYFDYCSEKKLPCFTDQQLINEKVAYEYINKIRIVTSVEQEFKIFKFFFGYIFKDIEIKSTNEFIERIAWEMVYNYSNYNLYDDVLHNLNRLNTKYSLGIISNAFPSLRKNYEAKKISEFFDPIIISSELGMKKNDVGIFIETLKVLNHQPGECIFVDDSIENCRNAKKVGMNSVIMDRDFANKDIKEFPVVSNLDELFELIEIF